MECILVSKNLTINSFRGAYKVEVINKAEERDLRPSILQNISSNSFLIADEKLLEIFPFFSDYWDNNSILPIKACEDSKTLTRSEIVIKKLIEKLKRLKSETSI